MNTGRDAARGPDPELRARARIRSERALASGELQPMTGTVRRITDSGINWIVRVVPALGRKTKAGNTGGAPPAADPLGPPYTGDLYVGDITPTHVVLLNKYNVLDEHLLLVTRADIAQTTLLDRDDFTALMLGLSAIDGLAFYNGGAEAGASQPRKHLQLVPLPLAPGDTSFPFAPLLAATEFADGTGRMPDLPCRHAVARMPDHWQEDPAAGADAALEIFHHLWRALGYVAQGTDQPVPYNLLATREWMWLVPRSREVFEGIRVNALGFAGAMITGSESGYRHLVETGPMQILRATATE